MNDRRYLTEHFCEVVMLVLWLSAVPGWAGWEDGKRAYDSGDYATAFREWLPLAQQDDYRAQILLGVMYAEGLGVPQDDGQAAQWYRRAAEQGHAIAQTQLGKMYYNGWGMPQDYAQAAQWFTRAAEQGHSLAQTLLGVMYVKGEGVPKDDARAAQLFRPAAETGDAIAQGMLGVLYAEGNGVLQDDAQAFQWYRRAADQGFASVQLNLGSMYANGRGVPQDYVQAHMWFNLAAAHLPPGSARDQAVRNRDLIAAHMTPGQVAQAQELARRWQPKSETAAARPQQAILQNDAPTRIHRAQERLTALGFAPGPIDGVLGQQTRAALSQFQRTYSLPITGELDDTTWHALSGR